MSLAVRRAPLLLAVFLVIGGAVRIVSTWRSIAQTTDETPNIACGMQWIDKHAYTYGAFHPPLARIAVSLGPYLYGARSQGLPDRWKEGNAVLHSHGRYGAVLSLARAGTLAFFLAAAVCVWFWSRRLLGDWGAVAAVFLLTNLPLVLAHSGIATTDMAVTAGVCCALYAYTRWLDRADALRGALLGLGIAFGFLGKFSGLLFIAVGVAAMTTVYWLGERPPLRISPRRVATMTLAVAVAFFSVWSFYRFSFGRIQEPLWDGGVPEGMLAHVPAAVWRTIERTPLPAPEILDGINQVGAHNRGGHAAYLLGHYSRTGWWYFFPVAIAVKTPLAFLLLAAVGVIAATRRPFDWHLWAPAAAALAILIVCLPVRLNIGLRYLLAMFPLLSMVAASGVLALWKATRGRAVAIALLVWLFLSAAFAHPDYLSYFNEIAARHPENFLVDSDLDWGQDTNRLCRRLKQLGVSHVYLNLHYTGDDSKLDLPAWDGLDPYQPVTGWVAVSFTRLKTYAMDVAAQQGKSEPAFAWLDRYQPVERVGRTILLYHIPGDSPARP